MNVNGQTHHQSVVKRGSNGVEWMDLTVDLSDLAGQPVTIDLLNQANDWANEFGYWNAAEIVSR